MTDTLKNPRAYLQKRVALFTGVSWAFFTVVLLIDWSVPEMEGESILPSTQIASLVMAISNVAVWVYTRRGERPAWACRTLDLATMAVGAGMTSMLPLIPPVEGAGGAMGLFMTVPFGVVILLRAAIIPSSAWLSIAVGLIWGGVMTATSTIGWEGISITIPGQPNDQQWLMPLVLNGYATLAFAFVAGVISHVVFGLQTKVREAMQLGQYTLVSKIGEGGMGVVYRARHAMMQRPTAIKLLSVRESSELQLARFEREVQLTARLSHPNTITIFDYGRTDEGTFYYAMELLDGASLQRVIDVVGAQPPERVVQILLHVAGALEEAHGAGLIHRDIKPANIILCTQGGKPDVAKLLDFGLVKEIVTNEDANLTSDGTVTGTPLYMAPETLTASSNSDGRSDIYSLGAVAYVLLTGEHVFPGTSLVEICGHHLHSKPMPPSERLGKSLPDDLERLVLDCLAKDPNDRPQSAGDLSERLKQCSAAGNWRTHDAHEWWDEYGDAIAMPAEDAGDDVKTVGVNPARVGA